MSDFTVFPRQSRSAGTYTSATVSFNGNPTQVGYAVVSSTWNTDDPSITVRFDVQQSFDNGATWQEVFGFPFNPGQVDRFGNPPSGYFNMADGKGVRIARAVITLSGTLTFEIDGSTTPLT